MKKLLITGILFLTFLNNYAQSDGLTIIKLKLIGKNHLANTEIQGREYIFTERIDNYLIDTTMNNLTLQLRETSKNGKSLNPIGDLISYDLLNNKIRWSQKINYTSSNIKLNKDVIVLNQEKKAYGINVENGGDQWELKNTIYYVEPFRKIGLGYNYISVNKYTNLLQGIDLSNGNSLWNRMITRAYGWNDVFHLNDSVIIVVASGLHSINLNNGTGWDYNAKTGMLNYTPPSGLATGLAGLTAGVAFGMFTGFYVIPLGGNNTVTNVVSNVLADSSNFYIASKEKISKLGHDGQIKWTRPLPEDITSNSTIFIKDSFLYLLNNGYAFMGNRRLDFGTPFFTSFELNSGKQIFMSTIKGKKDQINGFTINNDTILLVFKDKVSKYSMTNGSLISEKSFDIKTLGELRYFVGNQVYTKTDSIFKCLVSSDSTKYYLLTSGRKILVTNCNLDILNQIDSDQLYVYYLKTKDFKLLAKGNETVVLDNTYREVADFKASRKAKLVGSKLFDIQEKSFIEIDLHDLIKN
jgi:hypothetical protein